MREQTPSEISAQMLQRAQQTVLPLLYWYGANARDLPWRREPTPYHVWVSEVMLQQTRVAAVIPYYTRFLEAFPDIAALAKADEAQLLKCWQGLGYYSRARNLQKGARVVTEQYGGGASARGSGAFICSGRRRIYRRGNRLHRLRAARPRD